MNIPNKTKSNIFDNDTFGNNLNIIIPRAKGMKILINGMFEKG